MLQGSILQRLDASHRSGAIGKRPLNFGVYYKNTLVSLCHALEDAILTCSSPPLVITAFQRGKWYLQEADRYSELAKHARHVVIMAAPDGGFAEHPTSQLPNVHLVGLDPNDAVAQEWHLIIQSPSFSAMVLCQELSESDYRVQGVPKEDRERKFYGFWTFEANLVQETMELAISHLDRYQPDLQATLTEQLATIVAESQNQAPENLMPVVERVVDYLQTSQGDLNQQTQVQSIPSSDRTTLDINLVSSEVQAFLRMAQLTDQADAINPMASAETAALVEAMGQLLDLPAWQLQRLRLASLLHRLAPLQQSTTQLSPGSFGRYPTSETAAPSCPLVPAAQVLRTMPRLRAIATIITHETEWWDGSGQPAGLAGDEIPLESRILGLAAAFQQRVAYLRSTSHSEMIDLSAALADCQEHQGTRWDPKLVETLTLLAHGLEQGLTLPIQVPKIAAGLWLINSHYEEDLLGVSGNSF